MRALPVREQRIVGGAEIGDRDMGFFTRRERDALGKLPQVDAGVREFAHSRRDVQEVRRPVERDPRFASRAPGNAPPYSDRPREFARARQDVRPEREPKEMDPASLLQNVCYAQVREIDKLIDHLQGMRETLNNEASRVQRVVVEFATFSETTLQSSKVICESLQSSLRPLRDKRHNDKRSSRARRKAARRLARQMKMGNTGMDATTPEPQARPA
jgi:hypothetical protein